MSATSSDNIPGMETNNHYQKPDVQKEQENAKKEFEKTKKELEKIKNFITKKYKFVQAISVLPPQSIKFFIEEEEAPKESEKFVHLNLIIPDEKAKEAPKIQKEIVKELEKSKEKVWLHIRPVSEIWEICMDQKFELSSAISMSFPLFDKGILGGLRVAEIHKSLVLQKFEKYVVSYVMGGSIVRGDTVKTSDVDVFVIINDTDVKRMPRLELKERLRGIIYKYVMEASSLAGVQNKLEPQIYLLTEFWDAVKDAHPVMFTFIRDGVPIYDRGTFMPWKSLLRMGKLKPSPEAIEMFMSMGDEVIPRSKRTLMSDVFTNVFWGVTTPAQAMVMLNGGAPPNAKKELVKEFKKDFYETKMIEKKYVDFLEKVVNTWRDYEHEKIKEIKGVEIDSFLKGTEEFIKRLKELRIQIEKRFNEKTIDQIHKDTFELLKSIVGKMPQEKTIESFEKDFVKKGKFSPQDLRILKNIVSARQEFKKGKSNSQKIDIARKDAEILMNDLVEYSQRCDLASLEKGRMRLKTKDKVIEILNCDGKTFLFESGKVKKITTKVEDSSMEEVEKSIDNQKSKQVVEVDPKVFDLIKKEIGKFEILI
ncbi:MAG: nucleotidyltransferase domain-containing protein [Nanoarchaeota archaeon]|nr:nucleotidyltransferase domain-containing protein [Nanoarchaeota archaeon]